ncbi:hypothetical protein L5515_013916 [Caenorhabditis briggsae]|uniref:Uncharacterized protein n=1 Tax=Caenorhabditis briggsae TaxID=6238 RepID=A0AAE9J649_CAEBR|nr:hypothetical protein L5515_013916 [Caenorhabditis briggsae]
MMTWRETIWEQLEVTEEALMMGIIRLVEEQSFLFMEPLIMLETSLEKGTHCSVMVGAKRPFMEPPTVVEVHKSHLLQTFLWSANLFNR